VIIYKCQEGWETIKDHPIRRDRDLKPVQVVVAHLKTLFLLPMNQTFKEKVRKQLIASAKSYSKLLNKRITIYSDAFVVKKEYCIKFYKTNFLHLTGVKTTLSPEDFFDACFLGIIKEQDFDCDSCKELKGFVRQKIKHLVNIDLIFNQKLLFQENYRKGNITCCIATSDGKCTIGFVDAKYCVRPKTILDKNHLDKNAQIIEIMPIIK